MDDSLSPSVFSLIVLISISNLPAAIAVKLSIALVIGSKSILYLETEANNKKLDAQFKDCMKEI